MSNNMKFVLAAMGVVIVGGVGYLIFHHSKYPTIDNSQITQVVPSEDNATPPATVTPPHGDTPVVAPVPATPQTRPSTPAVVTTTPETPPAAGGNNSGKIDIAQFFQNGQVKPVTPDSPPVPTTSGGPTTPFASAADPSAMTPSTRPSTQTHTVAAGETFSSISAQVYGSSKYFAKLVAANPNIDPHRLRVGMKIVIPELSSSTSATSADATTPTATTPTPLAPASTADSYKVVPGDTLEGIAIKLYNDASFKADLYNANKAMIGVNPDRLKVGWVLKLPAATTRPSN